MQKWQPHSEVIQTKPTLCVALVGHDHKFIAVTPAFAAVVGYTPEELHGRTFEQITHPADIDIDSDLAQRVFRGELAQYEMAKRYIHKDGHIVRILLNVTTARGKSGEIHCAVSTIVPLGDVLPATPLPTFQHEDEPNDQIERIKKAMLW